MGVIVEGLPAGFPLDLDQVDAQLARRQGGHGRGGRMAIERDRVEVLAGLRHGITLGSPLLLLVRNIDHDHWRESMSPTPLDGGSAGAPVRVPRPGHADLPGAVKYGLRDLRNVLERASARETVNRVLAGAVARQLLEALGVRLGSLVERIGPVAAGELPPPEADPAAWGAAVEASPVRCPDPRAAEAMVRAIDEAREAGDTLGGVVQVRALGLPAGLGSHVQADRRLDGRLGAALLSLPAVKGLELGDAFANAAQPGREALDTLHPAHGRPPVAWKGHGHGGLDGGMTTGAPLWLRVAMKPLSTLRRPLPSVDLDRLEPVSAHRERSDVCAVPALAVVAEHAVAWELARALLEVFGADSWAETRRRHQDGEARWDAILGGTP